MGWTSKSETKGVTLPQPSTDEAGGKHADVLTSTPQVGHGKFNGGDWDPSTSASAPKGSGWTSRSETK